MNEGENRKERETEGRRKRERAREKEQRRRKRERTLESIRPETDVRNPSQPTDTQNWDLVFVFSVRDSLKRREFAKGTPRITFTVSFTSALDNRASSFYQEVPFSLRMCRPFFLSETSGSFCIF